MSESLVEVTFALDGSSLDEYERQEFAKKLLKQLREQGDAETVERTNDLSSEVGTKSGIDKLIGALTAEVKFDKVISFFGFVGEKFAEKPIEVHVKIGDREVTIKGTGEKAIAQAKQAAIDIQSALRGETANG